MYHFPRRSHEWISDENLFRYTTAFVCYMLAGNIEKVPIVVARQFLSKVCCILFGNIEKDSNAVTRQFLSGDWFLIQRVSHYIDISKVQFTNVISRENNTTDPYLRQAKRLSRDRGYVRQPVVTSNPLSLSQISNNYKWQLLNYSYDKI